MGSKALRVKRGGLSYTDNTDNSAIIYRSHENPQKQRYGVRCKAGLSRRPRGRAQAFSRVDSPSML